MTTRTYGLSGSGMDVDQMVKGLMQAQQTKYDNLVQKKAQLEWKKADYNTMYNAVSDFRNTVFDYKLQNTLSPRKVTSSDESVVSVSANSDAVNVNHSLTVTRLAEGVTKTSSGTITTGSSKDTLASQLGVSGSISLKITNGSSSATLTVDSSKSIYEFVSQINNAGINVKANYDANLDRFFMYTSNSGASAELKIEGVDAGGTGLLTALKIDGTSAKGQDAKFSLDGATDITTDKNSVTISGVTYNFKSEGTASVAVSSDVDKAVENVKSFVESYNSLLAKLNGELNETKYSDYLPLTDEQRAEMSDTQIELWEEKAKSGMLRGDSTLRNLVNNIRSNVASPVTGLTGKYTSLSSIGITTGTYTEGGKLYLDENKLKKALEADPDVLNKLFGTNGDSTSQDGVAVRLYDTLKTGMDKIVSQAGVEASTTYDNKSFLAKQILDYEDRMDTLLDQMEAAEDRYYNQFNAMETALNQLNQQSSWLAQQFSS